MKKEQEFYKFEFEQTMKKSMKNKDSVKSAQIFFSKIKVKGIFTKSKTILVPQEIHSQILIENTSSTRNKKVFRKNLLLAQKEVSGEKLKEILLFAIQWSPSSRFFAIFIKKHQISDHDLMIFKKYKLIHGYIDSYLIISLRLKKLDYYNNILAFFKEINSLIPSSKHKNIIFFRENIKGSYNPNYYLFSSLKGEGFFIKALSKKERLDNPNLEIQIIQIGRIIGVNVPRFAILFYNNKTAFFQSLAKNSDLLVEPLTPNNINFCFVSKDDLKEIIKDDAENLGRMLVFDTICGSWDRHCGNYLVVTKASKKSLQEIDFGLFQPSFYKTSKVFVEDSERQKSPSKHPKIPGWGIARNKKITYMMKNTNQYKLENGITSSIKNLHNALIGTDLPLYISPNLMKRINGLFNTAHPIYKQFLKELEELNIDNKFFIQLVHKLNLKRY